jgi:hypothetical protein
MGSVVCVKFCKKGSEVMGWNERVNLEKGTGIGASLLFPPNRGFGGSAPNEYVYHHAVRQAI